MGDIREPLPVLPLCAVFSRHPELLDLARARLEEIWGPIELESRRFEFEQPYYERQMGRGVRKILIAAKRAADPGQLARWKIATQAIEEEVAASPVYSEARPLNLDPGYVTEAKLVLATTKDRDHRIYLADGIYAEVTLEYQQSRWNPQRWTYPDYRQQEYHAFLDQCRRRLRQALGRVEPTNRKGQRLN